MTEKKITSEDYPKEIHWLKDGFTFHYAYGSQIRSAVSRRATSTIVTSELIEGSLDREGKNSWLLLTREEQEDKWGHPVFGNGPVPDDLEWYERGSAEAVIAERQARAHAWGQPEGPQRDAALAAFRSKFPVLSENVSQTELARRVY